MNSVSDNNILLKCVPLYYTTYNKRFIVLTILILLCFLTFISISAVAMRYELFNKQDFCDPTFYYGRACRNVISKNMTQDPDFIKYRKKFYNNIDEVINPLKIANQEMIKVASDSLNKNQALTSDKFINSSAEKVDKITDTLKRIKSQSLGELGSDVSQPIQEINNTISSKLKNDLPNILSDIQSKLNNGFIKPSTIHLYNALDKLYKATLDTRFANNDEPRVSPDIPVSL